jgi:hypothetical protein
MSGLLLFNILGVYPWRYTDSLSINGFITLSFALLVCRGLIFERIHLLLDTLKVAQD